MLVAASFATLGGWALISPPGSSPDDDQHLPSIWCANGDRPGLCQRLPELGLAQAPALLAEAPGCFAFQPAVSASCQERQTTTLSSSRQGPARITPLELSPPLFYRALQPLTGEDRGVSIILIRLTNAALAIFLIGSAALLLSQLQRRALLLAWLAASIPLGLFIIPSTNPSSWAVIGVGTLWAFLAAFWSSHSARARWASGALVLIAALIAAGSRTDAAAFSVLVVVAMAIVYLEPRIREKSFRLSDVIVPGLVVAISALFFLQSPQRSVAAEGIPLDGVAPLGGVALLLRNATDLPVLLTGSFGSTPLGWLDTPIPALTTFLISGLVLALIFQGFRALDWRKGLSLGILAAGLVGIPLWVLQQSGRVVGEQVQARYLLPLLIVVVAVALLDVRGRSPVDFTNAQRWVAVLALAIGQTVALVAVSQRFTVGTTESVVDALFNPQWWPYGSTPPIVLIGITSVAYLVAAYLVLFHFTGRPKRVSH